MSSIQTGFGFRIKRFHGLTKGFIEFYGVSVIQGRIQYYF